MAAELAGIDVGVLGPALLSVAGQSVPLRAAKLRALLTLLTMRAGHRISTDTIIDVLWGAEPPDAAVGTLRGYVAELRRLLEPDRAPHAASDVLVTEPGGYALVLRPHRVDAIRLETAVRRAASQAVVLGDPWRPSVDPAAHVEAAEMAGWLDLALGQWRGRPLADLGTHPDVEVERERLHALRLEGQVLRTSLMVGMGRHAHAVAELDRLCHLHPWHEHLWGLRALALAGCGRQVEALASLRDLRRSLADQLGIEADPHVVRLESELFADPVLPVAPGSPGSASPARLRARALHRGAAPRREPRQAH